MSKPEAGGRRAITVEATVTGIEYTEVGICGSETVANDGTYSGQCDHRRHMPDDQRTVGQLVGIGCAR